MELLLVVLPIPVLQQRELSSITVQYYKVYCPRGTKSESSRPRLLPHTGQWAVRLCDLVTNAITSDGPNEEPVSASPSAVGGTSQCA